MNAQISAITTPYKSESLAFLQPKTASQTKLVPTNSNGQLVNTSPKQQQTLLTTPPKTTTTPQKQNNVSPLTPDTGFNELLRKIEEKEEENEIPEEVEEEDDDAYSQAYSTASGMSKSFSETKSLSNRSGVMGIAESNRSNYSLAGPPTSKNMMHLQVLELSVGNPGILIGWKIFVPTYGHGLILSMKRRKFHTTRFNIQFENYTNIIELPLQRSRQKGSIPFTLIGKIK